MRHVLGAVMLEAGRNIEAEAVYQADLARHPENGWALLGLHQSLLGQSKILEAAKAEKRFLRTWIRAAVHLERSRF